MCVEGVVCMVKCLGNKLTFSIREFKGAEDSENLINRYRQNFIVCRDAEVPGEKRKRSLHR